MKIFLVLLAHLISSAALAGTYEVPIKDVDGVNVFTIENGTILKESDGVTRLRYFLPKEISGEKPAELVMDLRSSSVGIMHFAQTNPQAEASCIRAAGNVRCVTGYDPKIVRLADVQAFLLKEFSNDRLKEREKVAMAFGHEAIGILSFEYE